MTELIDSPVQTTHGPAHLDRLCFADRRQFGIDTGSVQQDRNHRHQNPPGQQVEQRPFRVAPEAAVSPPLFGRHHG